MSRGPQLLLLLALGCLGAGSGCSMVLPETSHMPVVHNPFPQLSRVAVAPFFNQSNEATLDGAEFARAYYSELQAIPGFEVVPVGVVEEAMMRHAVDLSSPGEARRLAEVLGVDAVVVGSITDYSIYYPPRCGLRVEWYAANPGFHPIPAGYGLPWGTPDEEYIPDSLVFEAEMALAREQMATQSPDCNAGCTLLPAPPSFETLHTASPIPTKMRASGSAGGMRPAPSVSGDGQPAPGPFDKQPAVDNQRGAPMDEPLDPSMEDTSTGASGGGSATTDPADASAAADSDQPVEGQPADRQQAEDQPASQQPPVAADNTPAPGDATNGSSDTNGDTEPADSGAGGVTTASYVTTGQELAGDEMLAAGAMPLGWPDARGFTPPGPSPVRPPCVPTSDPVMTHTRVYRGNDPEFTAALASYYNFKDEARFGGWKSYLERSDDFIRFCAHLHLSEMLSARGGGGETRVVRRWPSSR